MLSISQYNQQIFEQFARIGKAVSCGPRLELLEIIAQGERTVEVLANASGLSVANTSKHLQLLRQAGLVGARKQGLHVFYFIQDTNVIGLLDIMRKLAESHLADVDKLIKSYLTVRDNLEPVSHGELLERVREGSVTVIDVRPQEEFEAGHVAGAVNIPLKELEKHLDEIEHSQEVVAYCRGPYCVLAFEAVAKLREKGFTARRMKDGYPQWRVAGLPIESGLPVH